MTVSEVGGEPVAQKSPTAAVAGDRTLAQPQALARSVMIYGEQGMRCLAQARVAIFGIGGVGGMAAEALARTGIGHLDLFDYDRVEQSNLNRQLWATTDTVGELKTEAAAERLKTIRPDLDLVVRPIFVDAESLTEIDFSHYSYVVDAVDTVTAKLAIIEAAVSAGIPVISAMGAGNKIDPSAFRVARIEETSVCPLARVMRRELKKRQIRGVKVIYSQEKPLETKAASCPEQKTAPEVGAGQDRELGRPVRPTGFVKKTPGSVMFAVGAAGLLLAAEIVSDLTGLDRRHK